MAQTLMANVPDEIDYADAMWVGNYQRSLEKARACADRLSGDSLADYRAWWYYLAASAAAHSMTKDNMPHLREVARDLFGRACAASPRSTWFREASRVVNLDVPDDPIDDPLLLNASEAIERRLQQVGVTGAGFEGEAQAVINLLDSADSTPFEQGLERLGLWLGISAVRPSGTGVPDGVWPFSEEAILAFEAKSNESPEGPISLSTAREAQGHINWVKTTMPVLDSTIVSTVVVSDRITVASDALPNAANLFIVSLTYIRDLGRRVVAILRSLRSQAANVGQ